MLTYAKYAPLLNTSAIFKPASQNKCFGLRVGGKPKNSLTTQSLNGEWGKAISLTKQSFGLRVGVSLKIASQSNH